ncbi:glutaredoxin 2 [Shewanella surugensis]|uniref:Glutaredoxin 2 n=1 Tax=Shewanella surugensis TaxID=212020 RepID=A0ABT0L6H7_9GAMM|nr:glutaredoxin 2 [Shewanella surugensis]MCL1122995.1 glutaredoxin 2 [Shewanella surugensis]
MKLFLFDHCPYCIKAMMVAGYKQIDVEFIYLQNHDIQARIDKVGANLVPILQKADGSYMAESLDIARYLDQREAEPTLDAPRFDAAINEWITKTKRLSSALVYPRWLKIPLPEFQCNEAKDWFTGKKTSTLGINFETAYQNTAEYLTALYPQLEEIDWLILPSERKNRLSYDDVNFFPTLRNLTVIKDIEFPVHIRRYIEEVSAITAIHLYDEVAV